MAKTKDALVIKVPKKGEGSHWKPIMIRENLSYELEEISRETGLSKGEIANKVLRFGLDRIEIKKG